MAKDALVSDELAQKFASEKETAYTRWVRSEGLDIINSFYVADLHTVDLKPWPRRGGRGAAAAASSSITMRRGRRMTATSARFQRASRSRLSGSSTKK